MSKGLNKVMLIGHLGKDPELTYTPNGTAVARFSLATSGSRKTAEGQWEDYTDWHNIVIFGKTAEVAGQYLAKGRQAYLEGRLSTRTYEKEGQKHWATDVIVNNLILLGSRPEGAAKPPEERDYGKPEERFSQAPPPDSEVDEDLPF